LPLVEQLVLIDTSVWIEALRSTGLVECRDRVAELVTGGQAATCEIVLAEVLRGARDNAEERALHQRLRSLRVLSLDGVGRVAARIGRRIGADKPLMADVFIAATALQHRAALLHRDQHLSRISELFGIQELPL
jgi:predicted nucleic acid-binding protein